MMIQLVLREGQTLKGLMSLKRRLKDEKAIAQREGGVRDSTFPSFL